MVVDLDKCTGCGGCVTACAAENNVPSATPEVIERGRDMSWIRIERRWSEPGAAGAPPRLTHVPVFCQHCEEAPCEPVCPTYATFHTDDGLNAMVYARCVGTRYCANNCPWSVRKFNWVEPAWSGPLAEQLNPDVAVRTKGVIEKCTFCVHRIRSAEQKASLEQRGLRDGDVDTACAQSCPSDALIFGDLDDPKSRVSRAARSGRAYRELESTGAKPKVIYLSSADEG
jgi:molybdopterin-containing oxidoreductase family iron-sulfur binding subunit